ncbi:hypothetical protein RUM43_010630 [Polyplax serrata]|uniref:Uncharacterized protein n=1 Tax=Polyplax serrata TaxID=468196 RepID=A0AAN8P4C5_POLSC
MAFQQLGSKCFHITSLFQSFARSRSKKIQFYYPYSRNKSKSHVLCKRFYSAKKSEDSSLKKSSFTFDTDSMSHIAVTNEIQFFRDTRNNFCQMNFSDTKEPYGPPLAILLPWKTLSVALLQRIIEFYGEKGFDIVTVNLTPEQLMYPCVSGGAMTVVTNLLQYLNETHKHRPYIFHGFSIGAYLYGEILAQFSDQFELYRGLTNNVKGCLWDSPVDIIAVKSNIGKFYYPKNWFYRFDFN